MNKRSNNRLDYREWLERAFEDRQARNPKYSLRAFARDLQLLPSQLSLIMKGQCGLSALKATSIARKLNLNPEESLQFGLAVKSTHSRSPTQRAQARKALEQVYRPMLENTFGEIADWYYLAILQLMRLKTFRAESSWIADQLNISEETAIKAIEKLKRMKLIKIQRGKWKPATDMLKIRTAAPSRSIRQFHSQIIQKAQDALELQNISERDFGALIMTLDTKRLGEAKEMLDEFRKSFRQRFGNTEESADEIYALSVQFFRLSQHSKNQFEEKII